MATIGDVIRQVYPPDNYRRWKKERVWPARSTVSEQERYWQAALTLITSFLGIPNRPMTTPPKQSFVNIIRNLLGWQDKVSRARQIINGIKAFPLLILNLILIPFKLALNIVRIGTELLPAMARHLSSTLAEKARFNLSNSSGLPAVGWSVLYAVSDLAYELSIPLYFIGGAITSPIVSAGRKWESMRKADEVGLGALAVILSVMVSVLFWTAIMVVAAPALGALIFAKAPAVIVPALDAMIGLATWVGSHMALPALGYLGISTSIFSPVMTGLTLLTAVAGLIIVAIGVPISKAYESFLSWWHKPTFRRQEPTSGGNDVPPLSPVLSVFTPVGTPPRENLSVKPGSTSGTSDPQEDPKKKNRRAQVFFPILEEDTISECDPNDTGSSLSLSSSEF